MASRTGILSDAHSEKHCLEFNAAPLGYFQATYHELPKNPSLLGIKTPRYVQTVQKPVSLDVAAVNLGKLLHSNNHMAASFLADKFADDIQGFKPQQISLFSPIVNNAAVATIYPNVATSATRSAQMFAVETGSSAQPATATPSSAAVPFAETPLPPIKRGSDTPSGSSNTGSGGKTTGQKIRSGLAGAVGKLSQLASRKYRKSLMGHGTPQNPFVPREDDETAQSELRDTIGEARQLFARDPPRESARDLPRESDDLFGTVDKGRQSYEPPIFEPDSDEPPEEPRTSGRATKPTQRLIEQ